MASFDQKRLLRIFFDDKAGAAPSVIGLDVAEGLAAAVSWPDLAEPGYLGLVRPLEIRMRFRYDGSLRAQKVIPGAALKQDANRLVLTVPRSRDRGGAQPRSST